MWRTGWVSPIHVYEGDRPVGTFLAQMCEDCGVVVLDTKVHDRFHSILSSHGWVIAVLKTAHLAAHLHDKYDTTERIDSKKFDNWSADAFVEVVEAASENADRTT